MSELTIFVLMALAVAVVWLVSAGLTVARQGHTEGSSFVKEYGEALAFTWRNWVRAVDYFIDDWIGHLFLAILTGIMVALIVIAVKI